jgi:hypothetical protein
MAASIVVQVDQTAAREFVKDWIARWNAHDVDGLLRHFADDVVFTSPFAALVVGGDGVVRGKDALRRYWSEAIVRRPDVHFEIIDLYIGVTTLVINYRNQQGTSVCEVLTFDGPLVVAGHGTYPDSSAITFG